MNDDAFEWDEAKAAANLVKHKVSFETARRAFKDLFGVDREDDSERYDEPRHTLLGMVEGKLLFVAYTMRGDKIRIITARGAEPYEQRIYHEDNAG